MSESPFDRFPATFQSMLDKLPSPNDQGHIWLEGYWWRQDRDAIAVAIATLGRDLQRVQRELDRAREANDLDAIRTSCAVALVKVQEALLPILGADPLWPVGKAISALEYAVCKKRHWLTSLPKDELHARRDAPGRATVICLAAAVLDYFSRRLDSEPKEKVAEQIAEALNAGGFHVRSNGAMRKPSPRTVQQWHSQCLPGSKARPPLPQMRKMFLDFLKQIESQQSGRATSDYYKTMLNEITIHSRDRRDYGPQT